MPTEIDHYSIALVDNLQTDLDEVRLSGNLRIVRLDLVSDERAVTLLGEEPFMVANEIRLEGPPKPGKYRVAPYKPRMYESVPRIAELSNHALEWHFQGVVPDPFNENYDRNTPLKLFSDVITSLRLLKPGLVGRFSANHIIRKDPSGLEGPWSNWETLYYQPSPLNIFEPYVFDLGDVEDLKRMFQVLSQCKNQQILIALDRFNSQYARQKDIDKLIDLVVAFESLYLRGISTELEFRLATRSATHLGKEANKRKRVYDCLSTAYHLRSEIVHGSTQELRDHKLLRKMGWGSPRDMLDELSSLLREAIRSILSNAGAKSFNTDFHKQLDNALITGQGIKD